MILDRCEEGAAEDEGLCAWAADAACGVTGQSPEALSSLCCSWEGLLARWFREYVYKSCRECGQYFSLSVLKFLSCGASAQHMQEGPTPSLSPRGLKAWGWMNCVDQSLVPENSHPDASQDPTSALDVTHCPAGEALLGCNSSAPGHMGKLLPEAHQSPPSFSVPPGTECLDLP